MQACRTAVHAGRNEASRYSTLGVLYRAGSSQYRLIALTRSSFCSSKQLTLSARAQPLCNNIFARAQTMNLLEKLSTYLDPQSPSIHQNESTDKRESAKRILSIAVSVVIVG